MTNAEVINVIIADNRYKSICKGIAKKPHLADDLYQEFMLSILELKDDRLMVAKQESYLEVFCIGIIHNIWNKKDRHKINRSGHTSPLFEYHRGINENRTTKSIEDTFYFEKQEEDFSYEYQIIHDKLDDILKTQMQSSNTQTMYKSRVFYYSYIKYKNPREFSKVSGIPYNALIKVCAEYKKKLQKFIKTKLYD